MKKSTPATYKINKNPRFDKVLDISTTHITKKDEKLLRKDGKGKAIATLVVYPYLYGYLVYVEDISGTKNLLKEAQRIDKEGYSTEIINIFNWARSLKCSYIKLDGDGIEYEDLPTFDW